MRIAILSLLLSLPALAQDDEAAKPKAAEKAPEKAPEVDLTTLPFSPDTVKMVMERAQPQIQDCYEQMLAGLKKPIEGRIMTSFVIDAAGTVKKAKVEKKGSTLRNADLNQCVSTVLGGLLFPKPPDGRDHPIEFPFNLKAIK
jgi:hypothetical protein